MVDPKNGWLRMGILSAWAAIVVTLVAMGCASPQGPEASPTDSSAQSIESVSVTRDGDQSVVRLDGLVDPVYSVSDAGDGVIVVDLVGVAASSADSLVEAANGGSEQVAAYDGVVDVVTLSTFEEEGGPPLTRVEIVMAEPGNAEVFSTGDGLEVWLMPGLVLGDGGTGDEPPTLVDEMADEPVADDWSGDEMAATEVIEEGGSEAWAGEPMDEGEPASSEASEPMAMVAVEPPPAATQVTGVTATVSDGGVLVSLEADGGIGALEAFTLENPVRLVIDLPGLTTAESVANVPVESGLVSRVRVGAHAEKVRIVIDGGAEAADFSGRQIMPGTTGLWVAVGDGDALAAELDSALSASELAWAAQAAPMEQPLAAAEPLEESMFEADPMAPAAAADPMAADEADIASELAMSDDMPEEMELTEASAGEDAFFATGADAAPSVEETPAADSLAMESFGLAEVYGLHYERTEGLDRTAILSDESVQYTTSSPDPTTLVVSIQGARISEDASDRIFPKSGGPVSLIHAFQQPEVEVPEVRVVFTRAPNQQPVVSRRGSMLFIDFEDLGVAAAPPPAFPNAGGDTEILAAAPMGADQSMEMGADPSLSPVPGEALAASDSLPGASAVPEAPTELPAAMGAGGPMEVVTDLPGFESGTTLDSIPGADPNAMWDAPVSAAAAPAAVEVPAAIEVLEEGGLIDGKEYRGRRVSLDFKDVAIADVLRLIAEVSDLNIIAGDEVAGNVTIRLVEVPWDQALDVILMTKGLGFVRVGNVLRIAPSDVLKAEEEVRLQERRNKEKLEDLEVKLLPVNYAAVRDTEGLVKRLLSARGTVNLDERTNTLIIKDISSVIDEATALISAIDTQTPQVMIEAKIVEANLDFSRELGAVWSVQTNQFENAFDPDTLREDLGSEDFTFIDDNSLAFANPISAVPTGLMTLGALVLDQNFRVDAQIQAAESTGDGKVVSSPRVVTLDNSEARIEQGVSIPFQTFEGGDAKLEFVDAVLSLIVTPHITADESIIMEIAVSRNAPDSTVPTPTGSPAIAKNVAETETLVKDGQTLVLGGIYTIEKAQTQSRVPYLHRIPVIGNAFKSNAVTDSRQELLVFVTPRIVRMPEMANN